MRSLPRNFHLQRYRFGKSPGKGQLRMEGGISRHHMLHPDFLNNSGQDQLQHLL